MQARNPSLSGLQPADAIAEEDRLHIAQAADPAQYLTYETQARSTGDAVQVFAARRTGLGHIQRGDLCQDHCLCRVIGCHTVLAVADGISECDCGGDGARIACETAADLIEDLSRCQTETFARSLCAPAFYHSLRAEWVHRIQSHRRQAGFPASDDALLHYGTTLMFAVLTPEHCIAWSIGDGQILLFNDAECMPLDLAQKDSPAPHSLIYPDSVRDIRCGIFPRKDFPGVLLTTDGIHDMLLRLGPDAAPTYIRQISARFRAAGAPLQPFVYTGRIAGELRTVDLSRQLGAGDDCTLLLALDEQPGPGTPEKLRAQIDARFPGATSAKLLRRYADRAGYLVSDAQGWHLVTILPRNVPRALRDPRLNHFRQGQVRSWPGARCWFDDTLYYCAYPLSQDAATLFLEEEQHLGRFRSETSADRTLVDTFCTLTALQTHLACQDLYLHASAASWIACLQTEGHPMWIPQAALTENSAEALDACSLFPGLLGWLDCGSERLPLMDPGCVSETFPPPVLPLACGAYCVRCDPARGICGLTNLGTQEWKFTSHTGMPASVPPGKTLTLADGMEFSLPDEGDIVRCRVHLLPDGLPGPSENPM